MTLARVLVLGAGGMLGHVVCEEAVALGHHVIGTARECATVAGWFARRRIAVDLQTLDARNEGALEPLLRAARADAVVNCIGVVKQSREAADTVACITVNALLPHRVAALCEIEGSRLVHISTDCVFDGEKGSYGEDELPNATDLYGRSKALGEVTAGRAVTLRTSMIGWEISHKVGLLSWFESVRHGSIRGFRRAIFTGLSAGALARLILRVALERPDLVGLHHVASAPISKLELLRGMKEALGWAGPEIVPDDTFLCDRSLDGLRFWRALSSAPPTWPEMLQELAREHEKYDDGKDRAGK